MTELLDIHKKLYEFIKGLGYTVVDEATDTTSFPYVRLGYTAVDDLEIKNMGAYKVMQYIDVFSRYKGSKEVKEITYDLCDKITKHNFSTDEYTVIHNLYHIEFLDTHINEIKRKNDISMQDYRHGILIFNINIYKK